MSLSSGLFFKTAFDQFTFGQDSIFWAFGLKVPGCRLYERTASYGITEWWIWAQYSTSLHLKTETYKPCPSFWSAGLPGLTIMWANLLPKKEKCVCAYMCVHVSVCVCMCIVLVLLCRDLTDTHKPKSATFVTVPSLSRGRDPLYFPSCDITGNTSHHWTKVSWALRRA